MNYSRTIHLSGFLIAGLLLIMSIASAFQVAKSSYNVRPRADDYCFLHTYANRPLDQVHRSFYLKANGRVGAHVAMSTIYPLGITGLQLSPLMNVSMFALVLAAVAHAYQDKAKRRKTQATELTTFATTAFLFTTTTLYLSVTPFQNIYWSPGITSYFSGILHYAILFLVLTYRKMLPKWVFFVGLVVFSLLASTTSELTTIFGIIPWAGYLVFEALNHKDIRKTIRQYRYAVGSLLLQIIGLAIVYFSPGTAIRRQNANDGVGIRGSIETAVRESDAFFDAIAWNINILFVPLIGLAIVLILPRLAHTISEWFNNTQRWLLGGLFASYSLATIPLALFLNTYAASFIPGRTLLVPIFFIAFCVLIISILGWKFIFEKSLKKIQLVAILGMIIVGLGSYYSMFNDQRAISADIHRHRVQWDARDQRIKESTAEVQIEQSLKLGGTGAIAATPNWVNDCVANFYEIDDIKAVE